MIFNFQSLFFKINVQPRQKYKTQQWKYKIKQKEELNPFEHLLDLFLYIFVNKDFFYEKLYRFSWAQIN